MVLRTSSISIFIVIPSAGDDIIVRAPSIEPIDCLWCVFLLGKLASLTHTGPPDGCQTGHLCTHSDIIFELMFCTRGTRIFLWIFGNPLLINSLTINSVFINRAENHGFLLTAIKIRVVPDVPWCWEAILQWPLSDPRQILRYYWSCTVDRAYRLCVICQKKRVLLGKS